MTTGDEVVVEQGPGQAASRAEPSRPVGLLGRPSLLAGLTVLLVGVPTPDDPTGVDVASVSAADVGAVLLVAVVGLRVLLSDDVQRLRDPLFLAPVLMVVAALASAVWSTDPYLSAVGVVRYAELYCLVPLAVVVALRDRTDLVIVLGAVVVLGVVEGAVGVFQSVTGTGAGFQGETTRAIGTFGVDSVLSMATVVSVAQIVLLAVALSSSGRQRAWAALGAAALVVPLLLSLSRGALLSTVVAALAVLVATGVLRALRVATLAVAGVVLAFALVAGVDSAAGRWVNSVAERITSLGEVATDPDSSVQDRYALWSTAVSIWRIDPVTGVGIKQFPAYRDSNAPLGMSSGSELVTADSYARGELLSPHNQYLLLLSEQGVLGLAAYLGLVLVLLVRHLSLLREERAAGSGPRLLTLVSFGLLVWYGVNTTYGDLAGSTAVLYAVLLGVQLHAVTAGRRSATHQHEAHRRQQQAEGRPRSDVDQQVG